MGLFSTKSSSGATRRTSSDAQMHEIRSRARRRLIGALVLVLAAVLIVPFLTSNEPEPEQGQLLAVISTPLATDNSESNQAAQTPTPAHSQRDQVMVDDMYSDTNVSDEPPVPTVVEPEPVPSAPTPPPVVAHVEQPVAPVVKKPEPVKPKEPAKPATPTKVERTDDGAVALALLEGRTPPTTPRTATAAPQGNYILQIVAYSAETEARSRRNQLVSAGVTNAYVETANSAGKTTYRLRVGPFPTREAAQAAQTRLRSLGYENSFISTK